MFEGGVHEGLFEFGGGFFAGDVLAQRIFLLLEMGDDVVEGFEGGGDAGGVFVHLVDEDFVVGGDFAGFFVQGEGGGDFGAYFGEVGGGVGEAGDFHFFVVFCDDGVVGVLGFVEGWAEVFFELLVLAHLFFGILPGFAEWGRHFGLLLRGSLRSGLG